MSKIVKVHRIVDGDTFTFMEGDMELVVRVKNLDCFESRHGKRLNEQALKTKKGIGESFALGVKAKRKASEILLGKQVVLDWDTKNNSPERDTFGRFLAKVKINEALYSDLMAEFNVLMLIAS
jgi:endonuclease YncB( thermonuclease family)